VPGTFIGPDQHGEAFCFDPFNLYAARVLTNPNMLVAGAVGAGKSALVKSFLWRQQTAGRAAWVADPKGEYAGLAEACGVTPIRLGPGLPGRLNPFDVSERGEDGTGRRAALLVALAATALGRPLRPTETAAADIALTRVSQHCDDVPVLPDLVEALLTPDSATSADLYLSADRLADESRDMALALRRLCRGDLAGMFDAPTTARPNADDPLVVIDLSAIYHQARDALPLLMTCATAWLHEAITHAHAPHRYVVLDEAWALLAHLDTARWLQQSLKLARAHGIANVIVLHRLSDLTAAGSADSEAVALARGLLSDTGVRVIYHQPHGELAAARELLGLTDVEAELLPELRPTVGLWQIDGDRRVVTHRLGDLERDLVDTDHRMRENP
jgi:type IV secretory pathway VirB4 component